MDWKAAIKLGAEERFSEIKGLFSKMELGLLHELNDKREQIWEELFQDHKVLKKLNLRHKLAPVDYLIVAKSLDINTGYAPAKIYALYFILVHAFDDWIDDEEKFHREFKSKNYSSFEKKLKSVILAETKKIFPKNFGSVASKVYVRFAEACANAAREGSLRNLEEFSDQTEEILRCKAAVTGNGYAAIADLLAADGYVKKNKVYLEDALFGLGYLAQIVDELRDVKEDKVAGASNLMSSVGVKKATELYTKEVQKVRQNAKAATMNLEIASLLPWYSFALRY